MTVRRWARRLPWSLVGCVLLLIVAGLWGIARSTELGLASDDLFFRQVVCAAIGLAGMLLITVPPYRVYCRLAYVALAAVVALLAVVYFLPPVNGAHRWIRLGPLSVQPSELAKPVVVLALARYLMYGESFRRLRGLLVPLAIGLLPVVLILRQPDLGTAAVFLPVLLLMVYVAGARPRDLALLGMAGVCVIPLLWSQMNREQRSRVTTLLAQTGPGELPGADAYHLHQAKRIVATAGFGGSFAGRAEDEGRPPVVPEGATDSIFVVLVERSGLAGAVGLFAVYAFILWRTVRVAEATREPFGRLIAAGVAALIGVEVVVNTGMLVGLLPITGLPLPLVSYGGSGLLAHALAVGLVLNVALRPGFEVAGEPFRYVEPATGRIGRRPRTALVP